MDFSIDDFLGGKIKLKQLLNGYRATSDAVTLSAAVNKLKNNATILDVGSGTGAVSLCLAARFKNIKITGIELQNENVEIANENSELNNFSDRVKFFQGNIFDNNNVFAKQGFDCVISNPPFMDRSDYASPNSNRDLTRREENLKEWIEFCVKRANDNGKIYIIAKPDKLGEILQVMMIKTGAIKLYPIYSKINNIAKKIIIEATKSSKGKLEIMPAISLHSDDGKINSVAKKIQKEGKTLQEIFNNED